MLVSALLRIKTNLSFEKML